MKPRLALEWEDDGSAHHDVVLHAGTYSHRCDSYYFALDRGIRPDDESPSKVAEVIGSLLRHWRQTLEHLDEHGVAFLPFDFSDQCTAWLRVTRTGQVLRIQPGWSNIEGHSFFPSAPGDTVPNDFAPIQTAPELEISLPDCLDAVLQSAQGLKTR